MSGRLGAPAWSSAVGLFFVHARRSAMQNANRLPALVLAAVLGTALIGCQRQATPSTGSGAGVPMMHGERFGAPPAGAQQPAAPGHGDGLGPHHPPVRRPVLIVT
jgi:hypothetical protein